MVERDKLLDEDLEHIRHTLQQAPRSHTVRSESALEICAYLTLEEDVEESQHRIKQHQPHTYEQTLEGDGKPLGHKAQEERVKPGGSY